MTTSVAGPHLNFFLLQHGWIKLTHEDVIPTCTTYRANIRCGEWTLGLSFDVGWV